MNNLKAMKVAIPHWQDRISPVFDVATRLLIIEVTDRQEASRFEAILSATDPTQRAHELAGYGTNVLICGAISWPLEMAVSSLEIQAITQICGQVEDVFQAFLEDRLTDANYLMPGCCGRRQRFHGGLGRGQMRQNQSIPPEPWQQNQGGGERGPVNNPG